MAKIANINAQNSIQNAGTTAPIVGGSGGIPLAFLTELNAQVPCRIAGVVSRLNIELVSNSATTNTTLRFRKNLAYGNQIITIGAGATGSFVDSVNTDSIGLGDLYNYELICGATAGIQWTSITSLFDSGSSVGSAANMHTSGGVGINLNSASFFQCVSGQLAQSGAESTYQYKNKNTSIWRNAYTYFLINGRVTNTLLRNRINGANGSLLITVGAGATGGFEDVSNSDTIVPGDLINWVFVSSTGGGSASPTLISADFISSNSTVQYSAGTNSATGNFLASNTLYVGIASNLQTAGTESLRRSLAVIPSTFSDLECFVITNGVTATSTVNFRKSGANGTLQISIGSGATGYFEDVVHTDSVLATDYISYLVTTGASGTNLTIGTMGITSQSVNIDNWKPNYNDIAWKAKPRMQGVFAYPFGIVTAEVIREDKWDHMYPDFARGPKPLVNVGFQHYPFGEGIPPIVFPQWLPTYPDFARAFKPLVKTGHFSYPFGIVTKEVIFPNKWTPQYPNYIWKARRLQPGLQLITKPTFVPSVQILFFSPDDLFDFFAT